MISNFYEQSVSRNDAFCDVGVSQNLSAQSATHCPMTANDANCVRVVACIGDEGAMHSGEKIKIWSGINVLEYLRGHTGEHIAYLPCDGGAILMG